MRYATQDIRRMSRHAFPQADRDENRRSFVRACAAKVLTIRRKASPLAFAQTVWAEDEIAQTMLRAISSPTDRIAFPGIQAARVLPMLSPNAASSKLLALGMIIDLTGLSSIKLPYVGGTGRPSQPIFVPEGSPSPVVNLLTSAATLGPACKIVLNAAVSDEVQTASAETAEKIVSDALAIAVQQGVDAALFSNAAATSSNPAGLLNGVTATPSSGEAGATGVADDLGLIADAIGANGVGTDDLCFVTTPSLAIKAKVLVGPQFQNQIFSSSMLAAGTVIGIAPLGLATGYTGNVEIETSKGGTLHLSDTPLPLVDDSGTVATPQMNSFQQDLTFLKIRGWCAWAIQPGAVAAVGGADW